MVQALGHSTDRMTEHYSFVGDAEKRDAMASLAKVIPLTRPGRREDIIEVSRQVSLGDDITKTAGRG